MVIFKQFNTFGLRIITLHTHKCSMGVLMQTLFLPYKTSLPSHGSTEKDKSVSAAREGADESNSASVPCMGKVIPFKMHISINSKRFVQHCMSQMVSYIKFSKYEKKNPKLNCSAELCHYDKQCVSWCFSRRITGRTTSRSFSRAKNKLKICNISFHKNRE